MTLEYETLELYLTEVEDIVASFREDGATATSALASALNLLKKEIGEAEYKQFNEWVNEGSCDPQG